MLLPKMRNESEDKDKDARLVTGTQKPARQDVPILAQFSKVYRPICVSFASGEHVQTRKRTVHLTAACSVEIQDGRNAGNKARQFSVRCPRVSACCASAGGGRGRQTSAGTGYGL